MFNRGRSLEQSKSFYRKLAMIEIEKYEILKYLKQNGFQFENDKRIHKLQDFILTKNFQNVFSAALAVFTIPHTFMLEYLPTYKLSNVFDEEFFDDMIHESFDKAYDNLLLRKSSSVKFLPQYERVRQPLMIAATMIILYQYAPEIWNEYLKHHFVPPSNEESYESITKISEALRALSVSIDYDEHNPKNLLLIWLSQKEDSEDQITRDEIQVVLDSICMQLNESGENWSEKECVLQ